MTDDINPDAEAGRPDHGHRDGYTVVVNGEPFSVSDERVSWEQVVEFAYPEAPFAQPLYDVTFRRAKEPREGILVEGQTVIIKKKGTAFSVGVTDRS